MILLASSDYISSEELQEIVLPYVLKYSRDIHSYSTSVMNAFYSHYSPKIYQRKYGITRLWETDITPITNGYSVTTTYSDAFFSASHNSDADVFEGPFIQGYHGGPLAWGHPRDVPKMSPSPYELIEKYWANYAI